MGSILFNVVGGMLRAIATPGVGKIRYCIEHTTAPRAMPLGEGRGEGGACLSWLVKSVRAWTIPYSLKFVEPLTRLLKWLPTATGRALQGEALFGNGYPPCQVQGYQFCLKAVKERCRRPPWVREICASLPADAKTRPVPMVRLRGRHLLRART